MEYVSKKEMAATAWIGPIEVGLIRTEIRTKIAANYTTTMRFSHGQPGEKISTQIARTRSGSVNIP